MLMFGTLSAASDTDACGADTGLDPSPRSGRVLPCCAKLLDRRKHLSKCFIERELRTTSRGLAVVVLAVPQVKAGTVCACIGMQTWCVTEVYECGYPRLCRQPVTRFATRLAPRPVTDDASSKISFANGKSPVRCRRALRVVRRPQALPFTSSLSTIFSCRIRT